VHRITLLGLPIDALMRDDAVRLLLGFLRGHGQRHVATPNSEMLVESSCNRRFRDVLRGTSLNLPDSAGLLFAARWTGQRLPARVTGVDTLSALCAQLSEECPVFFLGGRGGAGRRASEELARRNPHLRVVGAYEGGPDAHDVPEILRRINQAQPRLLFVAYGAPQQDLWIAEHLAAMPSVRVAMGVGGAFDFLAGRRKRAPVFLQKIGLEWLWRLCLQPWRIRRIWKAVVVFPWLAMRFGRREPAC
jgi:N-acetylglucosaminyldiphosphoundecaprenol N-acetyl-beta-D-mannosaminyltransferase